MASVTLHYIHDPLCGWCYGASPLVSAARALLPIVAHGGGMLAGANRGRVSPAFRDHVMPHDRRIAELSGQPFGAAYVDGLLRDDTVVLDSEPPIAAVIAADENGGRGLDLLARLQQAHFVEGRRIADRAVLVDLATSIGLDAEAFAAAFDRTLGAASRAHIADSRALLARIGGSGFPTFALEHDGRFTPIDIGRDFGQAEAWKSRLAAIVRTFSPSH